MVILNVVCIIIFLEIPRLIVERRFERPNNQIVMLTGARAPGGANHAGQVKE
jgi:hypothetical protein